MHLLLLAPGAACGTQKSFSDAHDTYSSAVPHQAVLRRVCWRRKISLHEQCLCLVMNGGYFVQLAVISAYASRNGGQSAQRCVSSAIYCCHVCTGGAAACAAGLSLRHMCAGMVRQVVAASESSQHSPGTASVCRGARLQAQLGVDNASTRALCIICHRTHRLGVAQRAAQGAEVAPKNDSLGNGGF